MLLANNWQARVIYVEVQRSDFLWNSNMCEIYLSQFEINLSILQRLRLIIFLAANILDINDNHISTSFCVINCRYQFMLW